MKVGSKLALGATLAVLPLIAALAFTVAQAGRLAQQSALTAERQHRAAQLALQILRGVELAAEYRSKLRVTDDDGYRLRLTETTQQLSAWLYQLRRLELSKAERAAVDALDAAWRLHQTDTTQAATADSEARAAGNALLEASREALDAHATWAQAESAQVARWAAGLGLGAIVISVLVIVLLVRSLQAPLEQLIRGTRAVARGQFEYRATPLADDEFGEVTEAFNQMVDSLGELERLKAELVSRVSHELRTPLVAMIETNRLLLDEVPGSITEKQRRILELNRASADHLSAMIHDLLELSALEASDALEPQPVDLVSLTYSALEPLSLIAQDRSVQLDFASSAKLAVARCDAKRYVQVVQNLVDNAFKHSPSSGVVHVGLSVCRADTFPEPAPEDERSFALLRVEDEGPGVRPEERERIFEKFVQARRSHHGVGLGLAICRQIVAAHGGHLGVADSVLGGATFYAAFPLMPEVS